jgi:protein TonB
MKTLQTRHDPVQQIVNIWLVVLLHLGLGYLLLNGLGHSVVQVLSKPLQAVLIDEPKPQDWAPPPEPSKFVPKPDFFPLPDIPAAALSKNEIQQVTTAESAPPSAKIVAPPMAEPIRVAAVVDPAHACRQPEYPSASIRMDEQGVVDLDFLIETDGSVVDSKIARSSGYRRLDEAARRALGQCRFAPGTVDGKPERSWAHLRYRWTLKD